jgi:hypothetical protein
LKVPAARLREVNLAIENSAWGAFRTEFYPTYDYQPVWEAERKKGSKKGAGLPNTQRESPLNRSSQLITVHLDGELGTPSHESAVGNSDWRGLAA